MMEAISNFYHIFRSVGYIRILYGPIIFWISSFKTTMMEIIVELCKHWLTSFSHAISIFAVVIFGKVAFIEAIFIEVCCM